MLRPVGLVLSTSAAAALVLVFPRTVRTGLTLMNIVISVISPSPLRATSRSKRACRIPTNLNWSEIGEMSCTSSEGRVHGPAP